MIFCDTPCLLKNVKDNFYYNGIEISKKNFDITEFAIVCNRINEFKNQILQEKPLNIVKQNYEITNHIAINDNFVLICTVNKNNYMFGIYDDNKKEIAPLTQDLFKAFTNNIIMSLAHQMDITSKQIQQGIVKETTIKDNKELFIWKSYISNIKILSNSFHHTYELEFVTGNKEFILTDEELKTAIIER